MRIATLPPLFALLSTTRAYLDRYSPFINPFANVDSRPLIVKRQSCPYSYNSCSAFGYSNACCPVNTNCALDDAGHIACCPFNAACTGTVGAATGSVISTSSGFVLGGSTTTTSAAAFITPSSGIAGGGSTVPNAPFPFVYIPSSYANRALCSSYWTSCQIESTSCFSFLAGATGVTIAGPGITSPGPSAASSVCSELSALACYNLDSATTCDKFPPAAGVTTTATATNPFVQTTVVGTVAGAAGSRATGCPEVLYALGVGAIVGAAGVLL
jgi:hypothetical protein